MYDMKYVCFRVCIVAEQLSSFCLLPSSPLSPSPCSSVHLFSSDSSHISSPFLSCFPPSLFIPPLVPSFYLPSFCLPSSLPSSNLPSLPHFFPSSLPSSLLHSLLPYFIFLFAKFLLSSPSQGCLAVNYSKDSSEVDNRIF